MNGFLNDTFHVHGLIKVSMLSNPANQQSSNPAIQQSSKLSSAVDILFAGLLIFWRIAHGDYWLVCAGLRTHYAL
jgi:hypothetical protein